MHARKQQARIDSGECVGKGQTSTHRAMMLSRKMTWNTIRHDPSTINNHPTSTTGHAPHGHGRPHRPSRDPESPPASSRCSVHEPAWGPDAGVDVRRRGCIRTLTRPRASCEARGVGSLSRECPACGVDPGAADVHARGRAGGSQGPLAGWWLLVEGSWLVYAAGASPLHPP